MLQTIFHGQAEEFCNLLFHNRLTNQAENQPRAETTGETVARRFRGKLSVYGTENEPVIGDDLFTRPKYKSFLADLKNEVSRHLMETYFLNLCKVSQVRKG